MLSDEKSGRAGYDRWVVQDITRLILRLALWVAAGGDFVEPAAGSHPARRSTVCRNEKSAKRRFFLNMVGRAGYHSSHPETRPAGRRRRRCKIVPDDFVEGDAKSFPTILSNLQQVRIVKFCA
ncbi:hypothetical protein [Raoultella terrigena]|uniref:hypothetical protein n=1 Tax=Raoultella terrigena TaxID=577 RepID=UPI001269B1D2|nr:hypothetical protein [Raoultella terrigena]